VSPAAARSTPLMLIGCRYAPATRADRPRRADPAGQVLLTVTLASVTYATIEGPTRGWASAPIAGCYALAALGLGAFVTAERRRAEPLIELRFFPKSLVQRRGRLGDPGVRHPGRLPLPQHSLPARRPRLLPLRAGVAVLPATAVIAAASPLAARLVTRYGSRLRAAPLTG
jgi:hypothetical protein